MTRASRSRMPASPSPRARKAKFASWVRPDRISFPIIRTQAVTISGAVSLLGIICSLSPRPEAFEGMRRAGMLAAETLDFITPHVRPGITTGELDRLCHGFIVDHDAIPAPLNYRGFPKSICTSINHVVCHGIPGDRRLMEGDILNIDVTVILDGWHGDTSRMFFVGERIPLKARKLVDVTYEAMMRGIAVVKPGLHIGAIGNAIQRYAESHRYSVVRDFCGHGVGRVFHDAP